jgi:hypothetical protein
MNKKNPNTPHIRFRDGEWKVAFERGSYYLCSDNDIRLALRFATNLNSKIFEMEVYNHYKKQSLIDVF